MSARPRSPAPTPLLEWSARRERTLIEKARAELTAKAASMRPKSHRRIAAERRIRELTEQALRVSIAGLPSLTARNPKRS